MSMPTCPSCIYAQGICEKTGVKIRYSTGCTYHKPKRITNADRIRAMSDEELAEYFTQFYYDGPKFYCPAVADVGEDACAANYDCRQCWLDWLKQEAKNAES